MQTIPSDLKAQIRQSGWIEGDRIGEGGGGTVFLCYKEKLLKNLLQFAREAGTIQPQERMELLCKQSVGNLYRALVLGRDGLAAIKVPHKVDDGPTLERLSAEILAMASFKHPSLIRLQDYDTDTPPKWFVMDYHGLGTLGQDPHFESYKGRILDALRALRPLIEGVALLHRANHPHVHRDIKPNNIFLAANGSLILGDFGIIYTRPDDRTRLTRPGEVIVSRDWIPDWIRHRDVADFTTKVDVHMLARVLYWMITGGKNVASSQLDDDYFRLDTNLPAADRKQLELVDDLLHETITSSANECSIENADQLLRRVDEAISELTHNRLYQLVFNAFFTDDNSYVKVPFSTEPADTRLVGQILLPSPSKEIIALVRVGILSMNTKVILEFQLGHNSSQRIEAIGSGLGLGGDRWLDPLTITPSQLLKNGLYEFRLKACSPSSHDLHISAISVYAR